MQKQHAGAVVSLLNLWWKGNANQTSGNTNFYGSNKLFCGTFK